MEMLDAISVPVRSSAVHPSARDLRIRDLLRPEAVIADLAGRTPERVLSELCKPLGPADDVRGVFGALLERERRGSTGIADGLAIPHARVPRLAGLTATFGRSLEGIEFGAMDGGPSHFFFALFVPEDRIGVGLVGVQVGGIQVKALARICALFHDRGLGTAILEARDAAGIHRLISLRDEENR